MKYRQISFAEFVYISQRIKVIFVMNIIRQKGIKTRQSRIFNLRPVLMMISGKIAPGEQSSLTHSHYFPQYTFIASKTNSSVPSPPILLMLSVNSPPPEYIFPEPTRISFVHLSLHPHNESINFHIKRTCVLR